MIELVDELSEIHDELLSAMKFYYDLAYRSTLNSLLENIKKVENAWCGSWYGYRAKVYYRDFESPPLGMYFSHNWQYEAEPNSELQDESSWQMFSEAQVQSVIEEGIEKRDIGNAFDETGKWIQAFRDRKVDILAIIRIVQKSHSSLFDRLMEQAEQLQIPTIDGIVRSMRPAELDTEDPIAKEQGIWTPPHIQLHAKVLWSIRAAGSVHELAKLVQKTIAQIERVSAVSNERRITGAKVFIGHGHSPIWRELKDFLQDDLRLNCVAFEMVSIVGNTISDELATMLYDSEFAFLVCTAEDETVDGKKHPRMNVIHEAGLFGGRLGFDRAVILLEEECERFSNNQGILHSSFPKNNIKCTYYDVRRALEKKDIIPRLYDGSR